MCRRQRKALPSPPDGGVSMRRSCATIIMPLSFLSPKTAVRPSPIHGNGLFAIASIAKGEVVCVKGGHIFNRAALVGIAARLGAAEVQIGDDLFIGPVTEEERESSMIYSNHS